MQGALQVSNRVKDRHYSWAQRQGAGSSTVTAKLLAGYVNEHYAPPGDGVVAGPFYGDPQYYGHAIESAGLVLMSCHGDDFRDIQRYGADGESGAALTDMLWKRMQRGRAGRVASMPDTRGMNPAHFAIADQDSAEEGRA